MKKALSIVNNMFYNRNNENNFYINCIILDHSKKEYEDIYT